jgi:Protein of unknown function (DUF2844)
MIRKINWNNLMILATLALLPAIASAHLGGPESSVQSERGFQAQPTPSASTLSYRVYEITNQYGVHVREYVSNDQKVFAVTWTGHSEPDLSVLLGSHFHQYQNGKFQATRPGRRAPIRLTESDLIIEKGGHMGGLRGRAYIPSLLPAGLQLQEIQ